MPNSCASIIWRVVGALISFIFLLCGVFILAAYLTHQSKPGECVPNSRLIFGAWFYHCVDEQGNVHAMRYVSDPVKNALYWQDVWYMISSACYLSLIAIMIGALAVVATRNCSVRMGASEHANDEKV